VSTPSAVGTGSGRSGGASLSPGRTPGEMIPNRWLLNMRWLGGSSVLVAAWLAHRFVLPALDAQPLYAVGALVLVYNAMLSAWVGRHSGTAQLGTAVHRRLAKLQIGVDWLAAIALIHFSGGVESPLVFLFVFHIVIASLLFPRRTALGYAATALLLCGRSPSSRAAASWRTGTSSACCPARRRLHPPSSPRCSEPSRLRAW